MTQVDRAKKKAVARTAPGWSRDRMNETHRKGKRAAKKVTRRASRREGTATTREGTPEAPPFVPMTRPTDCPVYAGYCKEHGFTHGAEAEELRAGIEKIVDECSSSASAMRFDLRKLLDKVDARDSLAFREIPE